MPTKPIHKAVADGFATADASVEKRIDSIDARIKDLLTYPAERVPEIWGDAIEITLDDIRAAGPKVRNMIWVGTLAKMRAAAQLQAFLEQAKPVLATIRKQAADTIQKARAMKNNELVQACVEGVPKEVFDGAKNRE